MHPPLHVVKVIVPKRLCRVVVSVADRIALLLAIKEPGRDVTFEHIYEKVARDVAFVEQRKLSVEEVRDALQTMVERGLASQRNEFVFPEPDVHRAVEELLLTRSQELNRSYRLVWIAQHYYPPAAEYMLPFLSGRAVSTVKIFSGKTNPIEDVDTIFVRYAKYKPKPLPLQIETKAALLDRVYDHCIDFIPYIHRIGAREPDTFVLDLDAGPAILQSLSSFRFVKYVTSELGRVLSDLGIQPMVKFSGSRGFQIWARFDNTVLRKAGDVFRTYREMAGGLQKALETSLQKKIDGLRREFPDIVKDGQPITTADVAHKEARAGQILVDSSVLKPMGDVRAPFSIHYKTGLVSLPLTLQQLEGFEPSMAEPLNVVDGLADWATATRIEVANPSRLLSLVSGG